ncbi:hypothetical protein [Phytoactinopolyspora halotolerans]|uniref:Uncharacterized protein n=1 Tax=Phytoactinopolyspora halotolerans TaxID=1981512 RepID=A0A6L9S641_9ACTN|nr:hypothetical protein [Phytoactinopolyspora halotolerans]NED99987.1 hypothetical protein [Phytoactinopolyspora halotolerans]
MLRRRRQVPAMEGLENDERVLAHAEGADGRIVATQRRLIWPSGSIAWHEIERASWDSDEQRLRIEPVVRKRRGDAHLIPLTDPGRLVDVVRELVTASVVITRHVAIDGRRGVQVTGRRKSDGDLVWNAVVDPGLDPDDEHTRPRLETAVAAVRREVE